MKKSGAYLLLLACILCSCSRQNDQGTFSSSVPVTESAGIPSASPSETERNAPSSTEEPETTVSSSEGRVETFSFSRADFRVTEHLRASFAAPKVSSEDTANKALPRIQWGLSQPRTPMRSLHELPSALSDEPEETTSQPVTAGEVELGKTGIRLSIPEGYWCYRLPGQYKDADGEAVSLQFVEEYIFTIKNVTREELITDLQEYDETPHDMLDPFYKGPGYVVWSCKVLKADYLPIESLYLSCLPMSGEYRRAEGFLIAMGQSMWWTGEVPGKGTDHTCMHDRSSLSAEECPVIPEDAWPAGSIPDELWPVEEWVEHICLGTDGSGIRYDYAYTVSGGNLLLLYGTEPVFRGMSAGRTLCWRGLAVGERLTDPDTSVANPGWWEDYQEVLNGLDAGQWPYDADNMPEISFSTLRSIEITDEMKTYDKEWLTGWYADGASDHQLRAWACANLRQVTECPPEDVLIFLKDTEDSRVFCVLAGGETAKKLDPDAQSAWIPVDIGEDLLQFCDLRAAHDYAAAYLVGPD